MTSNGSTTCRSMKPTARSLGDSRCRRACLRGQHRRDPARGREPQGTHRDADDRTIDVPGRDREERAVAQEHHAAAPGLPLDRETDTCPRVRLRNGVDRRVSHAQEARADNDLGSGRAGKARENSRRPGDRCQQTVPFLTNLSRPAQECYEQLGVSIQGSRTSPKWPRRSCRTKRRQACGAPPWGSAPWRDLPAEPRQARRYWLIQT